MSSINDAIDFYNQGNYTRALNALLASEPETASESSEAAYYTGLCYLQLKRHEDALGCLEQVVTSGASLERVRQCRLLLAVVYALTGRERLAGFELQKLLDTGYKTAQVYSALAYIAWEQERADEALEYYETALSDDDTCVTALNGMGYALACTGKDSARALRLCRRAVELAPRSAACLDSLGWVYYKMGLYKDAKDCLKKAYEKDASNSTIQEHLQAVLMDEQAYRENNRAAAARGRA